MAEALQLSDYALSAAVAGLVAQGVAGAAAAPHLGLGLAGPGAALSLLATPPPPPPVAFQPAMRQLQQLQLLQQQQLQQLQQQQLQQLQQQLRQTHHATSLAPAKRPAPAAPLRPSPKAIRDQVQVDLQYLYCHILREYTPALIAVNHLVCGVDASTIQVSLRQLPSALQVCGV